MGEKSKRWFTRKSSKKPIDKKSVEKKPAETKPVQKKPVQKKPVQKKSVQKKSVPKKAGDKNSAKKKPEENQATKKQQVLKKALVSARNISRRQLLQSSPTLVVVAGVASGFTTTYLIKPRWEPNPSADSIAQSDLEADLPGAAELTSQTPITLAGVRLATAEEVAKTGHYLFVHCYKAELGQGVETVFAMLVGEALNLSMSQIATELISNPDLSGNAATVGSDSVRSLWKPLRELGATLAGWLLNATANRWMIAPDQCQLVDGKVTNQLDDRTLFWYEIDNLATTPLPKKLKLKKPSDFTLIGQPQRAGNLESIVRGKPLFTQDISFNKPTTFVMVQRAPSNWHRWVSDNRKKILGTPKHPDLLAIETIESNRLPHGQEAILIVGRSSWSVIKAKRALKIYWLRNPFPKGFSGIVEYQRYLKRKVANDRDRLPLPANPEKEIEATFWLPYLPHQTLEPPCCTISISENLCEVWLPTQRAGKVRKHLASFLNMDEKAIQLHPQRVGGGFGRKANTDSVLEAAFCAKHLMYLRSQRVISLDSLAPTDTGIVRLLWDREDDLQHDFYRPASIQHISVQFDNYGGIKRWIHTSAFPDSQTLSEKPPANERFLSMGAKPLLYKVEEHSVKRVPVKSELGVGIWRSIHFTQHTHAIECMIERIAKRHFVHPISYRLDQLKGLPRYSLAAVKNNLFGETYDVRKMKRVLNTLANERQDVKDAKGIGYAAVFAFGSYVAASVEVVAKKSDHDQSSSVPISTNQKIYHGNDSISSDINDENNADPFEVMRVTVVVDAGFIVNPDGAKAQVEGAIIFGLSAALYGAVSTKDSAVLNENFNDSPLMRIDEKPIFDIHLLTSEDAPAGLGEPVVPVISPALCNAVVGIRDTEEVSLPLRA